MNDTITFTQAKLVYSISVLVAALAILTGGWLHDHRPGVVDVRPHSSGVYVWHLTDDGAAGLPAAVRDGGCKSVARASVSEEQETYMISELGWRLEQGQARCVGMLS